MELNKLLQLAPVYRDYVWGGQRLRPGQLTAEAWVVYESDVIANGPLAGRTLAEVSREFGEKLLGHTAVQRTGHRFPLLIKLLDCAQWLSLQVHPNDEQARLLEGPDQFGKTEAWHIIEAQPGSRLIAGLQSGIVPDQAAEAIRDGTIIDLVQYHAIQPGDSLFMAPGTIHALGPGLLLYEVQQSSDLTYRVYDWGRPQTESRKLHIDKSLAVVDAKGSSKPVALKVDPSTDHQPLIACPYFTLEYLHGNEHAIAMHTRQTSFHVITTIRGSASIQAGDESLELERFATVLVPAFAGSYTIQPRGDCALLKSSVEII
ncbi:class I mannose-6-phosphate isomerase [bacterium]|nr:MAG: class I mannose-6-phosphate isomerase [bacterium]